MLIRYKLHTLYVTGVSEDEYYIYFTDVKQVPNSYIKKDFINKYAGYYILKTKLQENNPMLAISDSTELHINTLNVSVVTDSADIAKFKSLIECEFNKKAEIIREDIKDKLRSLREVLITIGSL